MEFPDTKAGWQDWLDEQFSGGLMMTLINSNGAETETQYLVSKVRCADVQNETPSVSFALTGSDRDILLDVEEFREHPRGWLAVTSGTNVPDFLITKNLSDEQRQAVQSDLAEEV